MIYEICCIANADSSEADLTRVRNILKESLSSFGGDQLLEDDWGVKTFAQPTSAKKVKGHYLYGIFQSEGKANTEILRRLKIDESVLKYGIFKLGLDEQKEELLKKYKTPFSKQHAGSLLDEKDEETGEMVKDRKRFTRGRTCWYKAQGIKANWKDPNTYVWLVNEFGKISPARVTGVSRKHQRFANEAIKRARQLGVVSHVSNRVLS